MLKLPVQILILFINFHISNAVIGSICSSELDCDGQNEFCKIYTHFSPPCKMGTCQCKNCHVPTKDGFCSKGRMFDLPYLCITIYFSVEFIAYLGDKCSGAENETFLVANSVCGKGTRRLQCRQGYGQKGIECLRAGIYVNAECIGDIHCPEEMFCHKDKSCQCRNSDHFIDPKSGLCKRFQFGNLCDNHEQCSNIAVGANSSSFAVCNETCQCNVTNSIPFDITVINSQNGLLENITFCISRESRHLNNESSYCKVDPQLKPSGDVGDSNTTICQTGQLCFQCPEDSLKMASNLGFCRNIEQRQKQQLNTACPDATSAVRSANVESTLFDNQSESAAAKLAPLYTFSLIFIIFLNF